MKIGVQPIRSHGVGRALSWGGYLSRLWALLKEFWSSTQAVAMIEFAVVMPVLVLLLLPLVDLGMGFYAKTQVMTAAQAGAQYAFVHGWSGNNSTPQTSILSAVSNATSISGLQATPAPVLACGCANGTTITYSSPNGSFTQATCAGLTGCSSNTGGVWGAYVTVSTQATYTPLFNFDIFGSATALSASSTVRVQ